MNLIFNQQTVGDLEKAFSFYLKAFYAIFGLIFEFFHDSLCF